MEELKKLLGEKLYAQIMDKLGGKNVIIDDGKLIPKHRFDCINLSLKDHKEQIALLKLQIGSLTEQIQHLEEAEKKAAELERKILILTELSKNRVRKFETVMPLLNLDGLSGTELKDTLKRQICILKKSDSYLFADINELYRLVPYTRNKKSE